MPFVTAELHQFTLDKGRFSKSLKERIELEVRHAAREFLRAAFFRVPYRTGFARGGFLNLMDVLKENINISAATKIKKVVKSLIKSGKAKTHKEAISYIQRNPSEARRILSPKPHERLFGMSRGIGAAASVGFGKHNPINKPEFYKKTTKKFAENARQFSTPMHKIFQWDSKDDQKFSFNYGISIVYFRINDFYSNKRTPGSPWASFLMGIRAFNSYIRLKSIKRMPNVADFLNVTEIRVVEHRLTKRKTTTKTLVSRSNSFQLAGSRE